jgi:Fe-S cluster biosynthesis and repair protein YggX
MTDTEERIVTCIKLGGERPGIRKQPFNNELGEYIFANLSQEGWEEWLTESVRYINTYRIDLASREGTEFLLKQLRIWLGMEDGEQAATAWTPPEEEAGAAASPETPST